MEVQLHAEDTQNKFITLIMIMMWEKRRLIFQSAVYLSFSFPSLTHAHSFLCLCLCSLLSMPMPTPFYDYAFAFLPHHFTLWMLRVVEVVKRISVFGEKKFVFDATIVLSNAVFMKLYCFLQYASKLFVFSILEAFCKM